MSIKKLFKELNNAPDADITMTDKHISIISAAIEIFSEKGYASTTTSEIAKRADVAEGTIFRYYKTKKDLLLAIPEYLSKISLSQTFIQDVNNVIEAEYSSFEDFLRAVIKNRREFASTNFALLKVMFQELPFHPELRAKISQVILSPALSNLIRAIEKFKLQGQLIDIPSNAILNLMFTSIFGYFFTKYIPSIELQWDSEKEIDYLVHYIMNGISKTTDHNNNER